MKKPIVIKLVFVFLVLFLFGIFDYFLMIPLNIRYIETFSLVLLFLLLIYILFAKHTSYGDLITGKGIVKAKAEKGPLYVLCIAIVLFVGYQISSSPLFFSKKYQKLIGEVEEKNFTDEFLVAKDGELPIVDFAYADKLGDKKLGSDRGLGSEYHVGTFSNIMVNDKLVMVAPLEFNGFFKWMNNRTTPGYVIVDCASGEVELVTELNGKKLELRYLLSSYFGDHIKRHAYFNGNMDNAMIEYTFELDDTGRPYYVISKIHKTIGMSGGTDLKSVVIVDVQTGEIQEYAPNEVPNWVDTVYPSSLVYKQIDEWGLYVNGYWNTVFGEKDIIRTTPKTRIIANEKQLYHYTGMTSSGSDESTVGFGFINTRTKQTTFYKMIGATEQAAMNSAEGKVENYGYTASFPIPINVNEKPTFFVTLKDSKGLIKQYAFVNIEDYSIVGNGETIASAKEKYLKSMNEEEPTTGESTKIPGKVLRIGFDQNQGNTTYYIVLENNQLYYGKSTISKELNITKEQDTVELTIIGNEIIAFDNLEV